MLEIPPLILVRHVQALVPRVQEPEPIVLPALIATFTQTTILLLNVYRIALPRITTVNP